MKRRDFLKTTGVAAAGTVATSAHASEKKVHKWKMVTAWPSNFPGLGTGAAFLADKIKTLSEGQIEITVYGAGEVVPAFEVFDAVSSGTAEMGHASPYFWKGKNSATQFFSTVPFGFSAEEVNSWLYHGGGLDLWQELYAPYNLVPIAAGNNGVQMGGWFNKEIKSIADLKGLKMRIPGLGAEVLKRLGGTPVSLPGGEIFTSLQAGTIDASEFVGPFNDLAFGLHKAAKYYYYPGWHEPSSVLEVLVNKKVYDALPKHLQTIVSDACRISNQDMLAEYTIRNVEALETLVNEHHVQLKPFPDDVLKALKKISHDVVAEVAKGNPDAKRVYDSYMGFLNRTKTYTNISTLAFLNAREL